MSVEQITIRYAKALFDLAESKGSLDTIMGDVKMIYESIKGSKELHNAYQSPVIKADKKTAFTKSIFAGKVNEMSANFLQLLINKRREQYIVEVMQSFIGLYNAKNNIVPVKLRTAVAVTDDVVKAIQASIKGNIQLEQSVDPSLIGGFVLEYDNKMIDASVSRSLGKMKQKFN